jgi:hypothetical protein
VIGNVQPKSLGPIFSIRIQRKRTKGWRMPLNCVSVTRPGYLGNPFVGEDAVARFRILAVDLMSDLGFATLLRRWSDPAVQKLLRSKYGRMMFCEGLKEIAHHRKSVACFCGESEPCHGDVILELAAKIRKGEPLS